MKQKQRSQEAINIDFAALQVELQRTMTGEQYTRERIILAVLDAAMILVGLMVIWLCASGSVPLLACLIICVGLACAAWANHAMSGA